MCDLFQAGKIFQEQFGWDAADIGNTLGWRRSIKNEVFHHSGLPPWATKFSIFGKIHSYIVDEDGIAVAIAGVGKN